MKELTKNAIKKSFMKLLEERPLSSITVKDIAEECGINRNTFYYHFSDIPTLLETIVEEECDKIIQNYPKLSSIEECLNVAVEFASSNRNVVMHIYHSVDRAIYENHLWRICDHVVRTYAETVMNQDVIKDEDREIILRYYKCLCFGYVMEWVDSGMKSDASKTISRLNELKRGEVDQMIERSMEDCN